MHELHIQKDIVNLMIESRENYLLDSSNYYIHDYLCTKYMMNRIDVRPTRTEVMILAFAEIYFSCLNLFTQAGKTGPYIDISLLRYPQSSFS